MALIVLMIERIKEYITSLEQDGIPQLSVNCVIFGFHEKKLKVIINKIDLNGLNGIMGSSASETLGSHKGSPASGTPRKEILVLPGGYVGQTEDLTDAVARIVKESTGLEKILFKQFAVFGDASRSFGKEFEALNKTLTFSAESPASTSSQMSPASGTLRITGPAGSPPRDPAMDKLFKWFSKRFVSICYLALVDFNKIELKPTAFLEAAQWLDVDKIKLLAMDHSDMVKSARETLIRELPHTPIASNLLPAKFILPELHALAEAVLGRPIDRPNFRRKILKSDLIVKVGTDDSGQRRPADLYKFKYGKKTNLNDEMKFGF